MGKAGKQLVAGLVAALVLGGLVAGAVYMFVLKKPSVPEPPPKELPRADELSPIAVDLKSDGTNFFYIDYRRGLQPVAKYHKVPEEARGAVVVWRPDFPDTHAYYVANLWDADGTVDAVPMKASDFEIRAKELATAQLLAEETALFSEDMTLNILEAKVRRKGKKRERSGSRVQIRKLNRFPTFALPGVH